MTLTLYNTLTRRKEPFRPIDPANVRMYVCGPTVYDHAHIGNARPVIVFDVLFRLLRHIYGESHVTYARNITDVDDKINARAAEEGVSIRELTERTAKQFHEDIAALGVLPPTVEPRATEHIPEMRALIEALVAKGHAYVADGHVLFDVSSMPDYGRLANRSLDEMEAGARVDVAPYKRGAMDFVLWKPSKPGEPAWPSPSGIAVPGRPGWHIECSAMAEKHLGTVFDIHGGGIDLVFPHHENEVAQSRCAHGTDVMANVWMHNGFLQVEGEKMSKSLGNFVTIREVLDEAPGEAVRLTMLKTHYRQPINWTRSQLRESEEELTNWVTQIEIENAHLSGYFRAAERRAPSPSAALLSALADDLNTPAAIAVLRAMYKKASSDSAAASTLLEDCEFLGLLRHNRLGVHERGSSLSAPMGTGPGPAWKHYDAVERLRVALANGRSLERDRLIRQIESDGVHVRIDAEGHVSLEVSAAQRDEGSQKIETLITARNAARNAKDFKEADRIRDELSAMGIQLKDAKDPATGEIVTRWEVKR